MRRRTVLAGLGAVAGMHACPALAQSTPVIGFLNSAAPDGFEPFVAAFRAGLRDAGYIEGQNVAIEYRWAEGRYDRLPALATDLVRRQVSLIAATGGSPAALAAKAATRSLPIVFTTGDDPVEIGIVASLSRPEGNLTGLTVTTSELMPKRLELLRELAPGDGPIALLVNPVYPSTPNIVRDAKAAARTLGRDLRLFEAGNEDEFEPAFAAIVAIAPKGLVVGSDPYFNSRPVSSRLPRGTGWLRSTNGASSRQPVGFLATVRVCRSSTGRPAPMPVGSSTVPSRVICPSSNRPCSSS
jgi:putative ABC transport system substrate-binding protein